VRKVVDLGALDPENIITPGIFVQRVVQIDTADSFATPQAAA
jgi:3-oxoadipate CoA-transferase alpha subunit